jgi:broad specificity phosphatase PhoE
VRLVLVRHCRSAVDATTPSSTWGLTAEGHRQAAGLDLPSWLDTAAVWAAGPEPKMVETLRPTAHRLGVDLVVDEAFRETDARWLPDEEFLAAVGRLFVTPMSSPAPGWESSQHAGRRLLAGVATISRSRPDVDLVVCSGGRALTSLLLELAVIDSDRAVSYWHSISVPDVIVVDWPTNGTPALRGSHDAE